MRVLGARAPKSSRAVMIHPNQENVRKASSSKNCDMVVMAIATVMVGC